MKSVSMGERVAEVDIIALLEKELQLLQDETNDGSSQDCDPKDMKVIRSEVVNIIVQLNCISICDAKSIALHKCQNSSLFE